MGGAPASHQEPGLPLPPPKRCLPQLEWVPTGSGFALPHPGASDDVWICFLVPLDGQERGCYWLLVTRSHRCCCLTSYHTQDSPTTKNDPAPNGAVAETPSPVVGGR